jgi:hypothetical protein
VTVTVAPGRLDEGLDLVWREVLPGPELGVLLPLRSNCSFYFSWRDPAQVGFCHVKSRPLHVDCATLDPKPFAHLVEGSAHELEVVWVDGSPGKRHDGCPSQSKA